MLITFCKKKFVDDIFESLSKRSVSVFIVFVFSVQQSVDTFIFMFSDKENKKACHQH